MRMMAFGKRVGQELLRDPLTLFFGLVFPCILLLLLSAIQANIPVALFELERLTPGIAVFGLSFLSLFASVLVAKDRESALLHRLYATSMTAWDFILGYTLPLLPIALGQGAVCFMLAGILGLKLGITVLYAILLMLPMALFFIFLGLLLGSVLTSRQAGGICGSLITNLTAWLSGVWFDLSLVGEGFQAAAELLPFVHGVRLTQAALAGELGGSLPHLLWVLGYGAVTAMLAVWVFLRQMRKG